MTRIRRITAKVAVPLACVGAVITYSASMITIYTDGPTIWGEAEEPVVQNRSEETKEQDRISESGRAIKDPIDSTHLESCDQMHELTNVRYGKAYEFYDVVNNPTSKDIYVLGGSKIEIEGTNYLDKDKDFDYTEGLMKNRYRIAAGVRNFRYVDTQKSYWRIVNKPPMYLSRGYRDRNNIPDFFLKYSIHYGWSGRIGENWREVLESDVLHTRVRQLAA